MTRPAHARAREEPRICAAEGCDEPLEHHRTDARYHSDACRARAWKQSVGYGRQRAVRTDMRRGSRTPDLRISYRKAVDTVADLILALDTGLDGNAAQRYVGAFIRAEHELRPLLTERQRAALERREAAP